MTETAALSVMTNGVRGAYRNAQELSGAALVPMPQADAGPSFADMVRNAAQEAATAIREGDLQAQRGLRGEIGRQEVVEATLALESTVKTVVALRDKLVEAYQEVLRMPI